MTTNTTSAFASKVDKERSIISGPNRHVQGTSLLESHEIEDILSDVYFQAVADPTRIRNILSQVKVNEHNRSAHINQIKNSLIKSKISPGFAIGIVMGQSLGQPITQMALSSFKKTGTSEFDTPQAKLQSVLRWTKNNSDAVSVIRLKKICPSDMTSLKVYARSLMCIKVADVLESMYIEDNKIIFHANNTKRFDYRINMLRIQNQIENALHFKVQVTTEVFGHCTIDPFNADNLSFQDQQSVMSSKLGFPQRTDSRKAVNRHIPLETIDKITDVQLSGIEGVSNAVVTKPFTDTPEIITTGPKFGEILTMSFVDATTSISHDIYEMYTTFGIEAARHVIVNRLKEFAGSDSESEKNICLLADQMCRLGEPLRVDRRGLDLTHAGFLRSLSFENGMKMLRQTVTPQYDPVTDPSARIIVGKPFSS